MTVHKNFSKNKIFKSFLLFLICKIFCIVTGGLIELFNQSIIPIFDVPHLLKGIRNNLLTKDLEIVFKITDEKRIDKKLEPYLLDKKLLLNCQKESNEENNDNRLIASWETIEKVYDIDRKAVDQIRRAVPKLTEQHVRKNKIQKMRVFPAAQVLSRSLASFTRFLANIQGKCSN